MSIVITKALPEHAREILDCLKIIGGETDNLTFGEEGLPVTVEEEYSYLENLQKLENAIMLVAQKDGKIVGTASFNSYPRERMKHRGNIAISVMKSEWGYGIGSLLMEHLLRFAKETAKAEIISLEVRSDNERAIHLYEKYGFKKIGVYKGFFKIDGCYIDVDLMNLYLYK